MCDFTTLVYGFDIKPNVSNIFLFYTVESGSFFEINAMSRMVYRYGS